MGWKITCLADHGKVENMSRCNSQPHYGRWQRQTEQQGPIRGMWYVAMLEYAPSLQFDRQITGVFDRMVNIFTDGHIHELRIPMLLALVGFPITFLHNLFTIPVGRTLHHLHGHHWHTPEFRAIRIPCSIHRCRSSWMRIVLWRTRESRSEYGQTGQILENPDYDPCEYTVSSEQKYTCKLVYSCSKTRTIARITGTRLTRGTCDRGLRWTRIPSTRWGDAEDLQTHCEIYINM